MSSLRYYTYPGMGEWALTHLGYKQAVRLGDTIHLSGQGGWTIDTATQSPTFPAGAPAQIDQAFANIDTALKAAGGQGWAQVFRVNSFHMPLDQECTEAMTRNFRKWMPDHQVVWTQVAVPQFLGEGMQVEIEVQAYDPEGAAGAAAEGGK